MTATISLERLMEDCAWQKLFIACKSQYPDKVNDTGYHMIGCDTCNNAQAKQCKHYLPLIRKY